MPQTLRPKTFVDRDFEERLDYGGELWTRADIIRDTRQMCVSERCNDRWLQGAEHRVRSGLQLSEMPPATPAIHWQIRQFESLKRYT